MLLQHLHRIRRQPQAVGADAGEWLGMEVKGGPVLFADFELDADEQNRRATRLAKGPDLGKGVHPKFVQELLGQATIAVTLDTHSHVMPGMADQTARAMQDALSPPDDTLD